MGGCCRGSRPKPVFRRVPRSDVLLRAKGPTPRTYVAVSRLKSKLKCARSRTSSGTRCRRVTRQSSTCSQAAHRATTPGHCTYKYASAKVLVAPQCALNSSPISCWAETVCLGLVGAFAGDNQEGSGTLHNDVGPATWQVGARFEGQVAFTTRSASMRPEIVIFRA